MLLVGGCLVSRLHLHHVFKIIVIICVFIFDDIFVELDVVGVMFYRLFKSSVAALCEFIYLVHVLISLGTVAFGWDLLTWPRQVEVSCSVTFAIATYTTRLIVITMIFSSRDPCAIGHQAIHRSPRPIMLILVPLPHIIRQSPVHHRSTPSPTPLLPCPPHSTMTTQQERCLGAPDH